MIRQASLRWGMSSWTTKRELSLDLLVVVIIKKIRTITLSIPSVLQLQPQNLYWPMVSLLTKVWWEVQVSYQTILPTSQMEIPSCMSIVLVRAWWHWEKPLTTHGISQPTGRIVRFERRVWMSKAIWKKWVTKSQNMGLKVYRWVGGLTLQLPSIPTGIRL